MSFINNMMKNMTIKAVTKKRFDELVGIIEFKIPKDSGTPFDPMKTLVDFIETLELTGMTIEIPPAVKHWWDLFIYLLCLMVSSELSYDPTMGSDKDIDLIIETANIQREKWKKESMLKKFIRREMINEMGNKFSRMT